VREAADPAAQTRNCPFGGLAQIGLELAERHLDIPYTLPLNN